MSDPTAGRQRRRLTATVTDLEVSRQKAYLIGVTGSSRDQIPAERSLAELERLTETAGSDPVFSEILTRAELDAGTLIGQGQAERAAEMATALDVDVVVFDRELTPAQQRNLQTIFECDVVDRHAVILDIFAQHATSRTGSLQVELALLQYHMPRLRGKGIELSRQAGGIGTRGPGETKLETDRRRILQRISRLKRELKSVQATRATQRKARVKAGLPVVALVGYTNAGKSTLLNHLTEAEVLAHDQLFSTLDSTVRRCELPSGTRILMSDTVGFVRELPHQLVEAFRSTLDEVREADLLLHLVDASDSDAPEQIATVRSVLGDIEAAKVPELMVLNKIDAADPTVLRRLETLFEGSSVSARTGDGIPQLLDQVDELLREATTVLGFLVPYDRGDISAALHRSGTVLNEAHGNDGTRLEVRLPKDATTSFDQWRTEPL